METNTALVKQAMWCFANMAAMYRTLDRVYEGEEEFIFGDGICETVIKLAKTVNQLQIESNPVFKECMFFIAILITAVREKQLV